MKQENLILKVISVLTFSGAMMANTKCQQQPVEQRQLKKNVIISDMSASNFLDSSSGINLSEMARAQYSGVLFESNDFFERNIYPSPVWLSGFQDRSYYGNQKLSASVATKTVAQLKTWFPNVKTQDIFLNRESACFMTRPQHFISGTINALEAYSGASLQFGFNSTVSIPVSAKFKMDKMRMDLSFHSVDPWTLQTMASVNQGAMKNDYSAGFGIDLGIIHIGPEFYRVTGMAEVVLKGLRDGTKALAAKILEQPRQEWSTRIVYGADNYVAVLGGAELGLKKGDKLKVFNETHMWNGQACGDSSVVTGSMIVSDVNDPWILEVEEPGDLLTRAKVLNPKENDTISTGALVRLGSFVAPVVAAPAKP